MSLIIDPMLPKHWPQVQAIYLEGIATGQATFETTAPDWPGWDESHLAKCRLVAIREEKVLGWAALSAVSKRKVYAGVAEVSVYIASDARGIGVGNALMSALIPASEAEGIWTLQSAVFPENTASIALHLKHGFREVGRRERIAKLHGIWRDTVLLERRSRILELD